MKKLILTILIILLCLSAFTLIACNGDDSTTTDNCTTIPSVEYNITYELNGGTNNTENPTGYNTGDIITLAFPTKDDYMFMGWYTDSALTNEIKEINNKEENLTLYADWIPIDEILEFRLEDGEYTIRDYKKDVATLIIPSTYKGLPVTELDSTAFYGCVALEKIIIPSTITSMGEAIFDKCSSLTNIVVDVNNPSYKSIDGILYSKNEKTLVYYPEGKTEKEYSVPVGTEIIGTNCFNGNPHIETINIPNTVTQVRGIVDCTALKNINIPDSVTYIGGFRGCTSLKKIVLSNSITAIYRGAFLECYSLENVTLSNS